ncbi:MAG: SH3 domain-containing protein [Parvibaculaceae bacterium]
MRKSWSRPSGQPPAAWCLVALLALAPLEAAAQSSGGSGSSDVPATGSSGERIYRVIDHRAPDMLNVRSGPGTQFGIVTRIAADARDVRVSECQTVSGYAFKWCLTDYNGERGWVYARYLADTRTDAKPE